MQLTKVERQTMEADYVASHFRLLKRAGGSISKGNRLTANKVPRGPRTYCMSWLIAQVLARDRR